MTCNIKCEASIGTGNNDIPSKVVVAPPLQSSMKDYGREMVLIKRI